jgi:hypothetical protein
MCLVRRRHKMSTRSLAYTLLFQVFVIVLHSSGRNVVKLSNVKGPNALQITLSYIMRSCRFGTPYSLKRWLDIFLLEWFKNNYNYLSTKLYFPYYIFWIVDAIRIIYLYWLLSMCLLQEFHQILPNGYQKCHCAHLLKISEPWYTMSSLFLEHARTVFFLHII